MMFKELVERARTYRRFVESDPVPAEALANRNLLSELPDNRAATPLEVPDC